MELNCASDLTPRHRGFANEDFGDFAALYHEQLQEQLEVEK